MSMDGCLRFAGTAGAVHQKRDIIGGHRKWWRTTIAAIAKTGMGPSTFDGNYAYVPADALQELPEEGSILVFGKD